MTVRDQEALEDIVGVIDRALGFPITDFDSFEQTDDLQDALIRCLEVMGEAVKRLSPELASSTAICLGVGWRACVIC